MLTEDAASSAEAREKAYKLWDGSGLFLHVTPTGARSWRLKFRQAGRERLRVIGRHPHMTLSHARQIAGEIRGSLRRGVMPPSDVRRVCADLSDDYDRQITTLRSLATEGELKVYFIQAGPGGPIKVGLSRTPAERLGKMQIWNFEPLTLLGTMAGSALHESLLHFIFADEHLRGEWFQPSIRLLSFLEGVSC